MDKQPYGADFEIVTFHNDTDCREYLTPLLENAEPRLERAAERLLALVSRTSKTVIVESNYIDVDYKASFGRFYFLKHRDIGKRCQRLHFFSDHVTDEDLLDLSDELKSSYLGFVVLRPLPAYRLGRSLLSRSVLTQAPSSSAFNDTYHLTCATQYNINIGGNSVPLIGSPWMQQDTMVCACASASLWMANWHLCHRFSPEFTPFTTPQITDLASQYSLDTGRSMPSEGLTVEQMLAALKGMGYGPLIRFPKTATEAVKTVYYYVESSIPVIAILTWDASRSGHAVTITGHTLRAEYPQNEKVQESTSGLRFCSSTEFVPRFVLQDDSGGPFRFVELLDWKTAANLGLISAVDIKVLESRYRCAMVFDRGTQYQKIGYLRSLLVPLPPRVTLHGHDADRQAQAIINRWYMGHNELPARLISTRTFLQPSNDIKSWWSPLSDRPLPVRTHPQLTSSHTLFGLIV